MLEKRSSLLATVLFALTATTPAVAAEMPGANATEIKIGNTNPHSGPASAYSVFAKLETAFFEMVNDQGGVAGRRINYISLDDGDSPPKTVEQVRRLVEGRTRLRCSSTPWAPRPIRRSDVMSTSSRCRICS
jgi:branched-chain amino acid transport system substrate-binding protein